MRETIHTGLGWTLLCQLESLARNLEASLPSAGFRMPRTWLGCPTIFLPLLSRLAWLLCLACLAYLSGIYFGTRPKVVEALPFAQPAAYASVGRFLLPKPPSAETLDPTACAFILICNIDLGVQYWAEKAAWRVKVGSLGISSHLSTRGDATYDLEIPPVKGGGGGGGMARDNQKQDFWDSIFSFLSRERGLRVSLGQEGAQRYAVEPVQLYQPSPTSP